MSAQSIFNPASFTFCRQMTPDDHSKVLKDFVQAVEVAAAAGFDCIEVHMGHGYLMSQYLSPHLNPNTLLVERLAFPVKVCMIAAVLCCVVQRIKKTL